MKLRMKFSAGCLECRPAEASRCYERPHQTFDVWLQSLEQRDALCFTNECSDEVWGLTRLYCKEFAGSKASFCKSVAAGGEVAMSEVQPVKQEPPFAAFVGIDWADQKHVWCLQTVDSEKRESGELEHTPEAVETWVGQLCQGFDHRPIAVAVEQSRGALVFMLSKYAPLHLFPVPSTMAAKMREALYPSGAKDDPRDADLLLDLLLQHGDK